MTPNEESYRNDAVQTSVVLSEGCGGNVREVGDHKPYPGNF